MTFTTRLAAILALTSMVAASGCGQSGLFDAVVEVRVGDVSAEVAADGAARLAELHNLRFGAAGVVESIHLGEGAIVRAGEVIAELDDDALAVAHIKAKADLLAAEAALEDLVTPPSALELELAQAAVQDEIDALVNAQAALDVAMTVGRQSIDDARRARDEAYEAYRFVFRNYYGFQPSDDHILDAPSDILDDRGNPGVLAYWGTLAPSVPQSDIDKELDAAWRAARDAANRFARSVSNNDRDLVNASKAVSRARESLGEAEEHLQALQDGPDAVAIGKAEAAYASAMQALEAADDARLSARLTAPFDGTLLELTIEPGETISAATVVGLFADTERMEVVALVGEADVLRVAVGQRASVSPLAAPFDAVEGVVTAIGQLPAPGAALRYPVTIDARTPGLKDGMRVAVEIELERKTGVLVLPVGAVQRDRLQYVVQVVGEDGLTSQRQVRIGAFDQFNVEITSGVLEGEIVVDFTTPVSQSSFLRDGRPLR